MPVVQTSLLQPPPGEPKPFRQGPQYRSFTATAALIQSSRGHLGGETPCEITFLRDEFSWEGFSEEGKIVGKPTVVKEAVVHMRLANLLAVADAIQAELEVIKETMARSAAEAEAETGSPPDSEPQNGGSLH